MIRAGVVAAAVALAGCGVPSQPPGPAPTSPPRAIRATADDSPEGPDGPVAFKPARTPNKGPVPANTCFVDYLDVGSGLAILIRCKDGAGKELNILYDAGTSQGHAGSEYRVVYLMEQGLGFMRGSTIHHLIHSHPHFDHHSDMSSERGVIALYDVKNVWDPAMYEDTEAYRCFLHAVTKKQKSTDLIYHPAKKCPQTRNLTCDGGAVGYFVQAQVKPYDAPSIAKPSTVPYDIDFGDSIKGKILYSDPDAKKPNAAALVLNLSMYGVTMLLTADEEAGERESPSNAPDANSVEAFLIAPARRTLMRANIIQVPHHGSLTSSRNAFKDATIIKAGTSVDSYAVISSGTRKYGTVALPDNEQVRSWRQKLGAGRLLSTTTDDSDCESASAPLKIAPTSDRGPTGCTSVEFVIKKSGSKGKITKVFYWPAGPEVL